MMLSLSPQSRRRIAWGIGAALILAAGTATWMLFHRETLVLVSGKVMVDGKPMEQGTVTFFPNKAKGNMSSLSFSSSIKNGAYEIGRMGKRGAPPGWYRVIVEGFVASDVNNPVNQGQMAKITYRKGPDAEKSVWVPALDPASHFSNSNNPLALEVVKSVGEQSYDLQLTRSPPRRKFPGS